MPDSLHVLVFGAGATGSVFAARLARRNRVTVVARGAQLAAIRQDGLRVRGATEATVRVEARETPEGPLDFVLVTVKAGDTRAAAETLRGLDGATLVSLQNGLGNEEILAVEHGELLEEP